MRSLLTVARWEMIILVAAFGAVTLWKLFQSANFSDLIRSSDGTRAISPARVQLLMLTALTALQYLLATLRDPSHFPAVPQGLVMGIGGSQALYLGAKAWSIFAPKRNNTEEK